MGRLEKVAGGWMRVGHTVMTNNGIYMPMLVFKTE
jgi:hypothetical protein